VTSSGTFALQAGTVSAVLSGTGAVSKTTADTVTLSGANTYTGGTAISAGSVIVGNNSAFGTGIVSMAAGTTMSFLSGGNFNVGNEIQISGDPTFTAPSGTVQTLSGVIADGSGSGTVVKDGFGTLVLTASNTYSGQTNVNAGTLDVTGSIASSLLTTVAS
jgi:autotransporter-associated beta strand protein